jgi:hypothetical protein
MQRGTSNEAMCLLTALGVHCGILGLLLSLATPTCGEKAKTLEQRQLKQCTWVRLVELAVFDYMSRLPYLPYRTVLTPSLGTTLLCLRVQAYWGMVSYTPAFATSPGDLSMLALLLVFLIWHACTAALWTWAMHTQVVQPFEHAVLSTMTIDNASISLVKVSNIHLSPLRSLAVCKVHKAIVHLARRTLVCAVLGTDAQLGQE